VLPCGVIKNNYNSRGKEEGSEGYRREEKRYDGRAGEGICRTHVKLLLTRLNDPRTFLQSPSDFLLASYV